VEINDERFEHDGIGIGIGIEMVCNGMGVLTMEMCLHGENVGSPRLPVAYETKKKRISATCQLIIVKLPTCF